MNKERKKKPGAAARKLIFLLVLLTLAILASHTLSCGDGAEYNRVESGVEDLLKAMAESNADDAFACLSVGTSRTDFDARYAEICEKYAPSEDADLSRVSESSYFGVGDVEYTLVLRVTDGDREFYITASVIEGEEGLDSVSFHDEDPTKKEEN